MKVEEIKLKGCWVNRGWLRARRSKFRVESWYLAAHKNALRREETRAQFLDTSAADGII
jgi:hypothetical protein